VTGTITTTLVDPPVCSTSFDHVWVTVTKVTANISSTAADTDSGLGNSGGPDFRPQAA
jgi:hypothetical protein